MGFNKYYIPEPTRLAEQIKRVGPAQVVNRKIDAILGSAVSIDMFKFICDSLHLGLSEAEVMLELAKKYPEYFAESN